jgi:hypothetical protein
LDDKVYFSAEVSYRGKFDGNLSLKSVLKIPNNYTVLQHIHEGGQVFEREVMESNYTVLVERFDDMFSDCPFTECVLSLDLGEPGICYLDFILDARLQDNSYIYDSEEIPYDSELEAVTPAQVGFFDEATSVLCQPISYVALILALLFALLVYGMKRVDDYINEPSNI